MSASIIIKQKLKPLFLHAVLLLFILLGVNGCTADTKDEADRFMPDHEAEDLAESIREEATLSLGGDLEASLWSSEILLSDPVGLNFDNMGRAWVVTTPRRHNSVPDAGALRQYFPENLSFRTVEDRRDFLHDMVIDENSHNFSWVQDHNGDGLKDWRDLGVQRDSVFVIEDLTGNGLANQARIYDWDLYDEVSEFAAGVLYHDGDIFMTLAPDVWRISDSNGDGVWDKPKSISHGYGVHYGYSGHSMSGLKLGPDGRIYWAVGDIGLNVVDDEGNRWYHPDTGAIMRSEPDGSNFEVYAYGLRNTHEFDFDEYGNLIGVDNDGPIGDTDRLVYLINGSDSGWRIYWQMGKFSDPKNNDYRVWLEEKYSTMYFEDQPAHILPPISEGYSGPSGFTYNPGTALNENWADHFFSATFVGSLPHSGISGFTLEEHDSHYARDTSRTVLRGFLATSLDFGTDGALYSTDWIQGWRTKGTGRIWKLDTPGNANSPIRLETKDLLAEDFGERTSEELTDLLGHQDMRVRKKAQFELVKRNDTEYLLSALEQTEQQLARIHGIWGVAQSGRKDPATAEPLMDYLDDPDPEIRAQAAKMLGDLRYELAAEPLITLLEDDVARVQLFAAEALGRLAHNPAIPHLVEMLRVNNDEDPYLRNAGFIALARIGDTEALVNLADHPSRAVRIAALVALRRLNDPNVALFLHDDDENIVTDAARAINDEEFLEGVLPALAEMLDQDRFINEPLMRRAINANLYGGEQVNADRIAAFSARVDISNELRVEALNTLALWAHPSLLDRVNGMYRGPVRNNPQLARQALEPHFTQILNDSNSAVKVAGLDAAGNLKSTNVLPEILTLIDDDQSPDVRAASLNSLLKMDYDQIGDVITLALNDDEQKVRMNALSHIIDLDIPDEDAVALLEQVLQNGSAEERQTALETLSQIDSPASYAVLDRQIDLLVNGDLINEIQLDLIHAVEANDSEQLHKRIQRYESSKSKRNKVKQYIESLHGGDASNGRNIFRNHADAQCYRCHTSGGAGPDLSTVGERLSRKQILQAMVEPHARIAPGYGIVTLTLKNGEIVRNVLISETETSITVLSGNQERRIDKSDIAKRVNSPSSMPPMGDILNRAELRDLVEYLSNLG